MRISKDLLQLFCKSLGISDLVTKEILKNNICQHLCNNEKKITTLRSLIRYKKDNNKIKQIAVDIKQMLDDDSTDQNIAKSLTNLYGIKIEKMDVFIFAEILDAYGKKDTTYIEEKLEEWGNKAKYGIELVKAFDKKIL